jgi:hypothetical protein
MMDRFFFTRFFNHRFWWTPYRFGIFAQAMGTHKIAADFGQAVTNLATRSLDQTVAPVQLAAARRQSVISRPV